MPATTHKPTADPWDLKPLAEREAMPVILTDHWVTRRQRVHTAVFPDNRPHITSYNLVEVLNLALEHPGDRAILGNVDLDGTLFACYISVHPYSAEDRDNGKT